MANKKSVAEVITEAVKHAGGINKVTLESDVSKTQIYSIMKGEKYNIETLRRLCAYFGYQIYIE